MTYARKPYMDKWRNARLAAGDTQRSVWFTPQMLQDLSSLKIALGLSVEKTIAEALQAMRKEWQEP